MLHLSSINLWKLFTDAVARFIETDDRIQKSMVKLYYDQLEIADDERELAEAIYTVHQPKEPGEIIEAIAKGERATRERMAHKAYRFAEEVESNLKGPDEVRILRAFAHRIGW